MSQLLLPKPDEPISRMCYIHSLGKNRGPRQLKLLFLLTGMGEAIRIFETVHAAVQRVGAFARNVHLTSFCLIAKKTFYLYYKLHCFSYIH